LSSQALSERERRFIDAYIGEACGNATKAATIAGYSGQNARQQASRLLTKANIRAALADRQQSLIKATIADAAERREFLTRLMRNTELDPRDRLKACDQLNRLAGEYSEKREYSGAVQVLASAIDERL
jgi:phage terminase small subunit